MNRTQQDAWKREALDMSFQALASCTALSQKIVYKGARILALRLGGQQRASYDLDANILLSFAVNVPDRDEQAAILRQLFTQAISDFASEQDPVRFEVLKLTLSHRPRNDHPMGWNAFDVKVQLNDFSNDGVRGLPSIDFDVAAPETLGEVAVAPLEVDGHTVFAYTLERIAGEKLRAFLSSLPAYRSKVQKPGDAVRVKDLYDVARILSVHSLEGDAAFWKNAGEEFQLACASRYIDCAGINTFSEDIGVTQAIYQADPTLPKDVDFNDAWNSIASIVAHWERLGILPVANPIPGT